MTAFVRATVSTYNDTVDLHRRESLSRSKFWSHYNGFGGLSYKIYYNGWNVGLLTKYNLHGSTDQSWYFVGLVPDPPSLDLKTFIPVAMMYTTTRQACQGTWAITRGGVQLVDGSCNGTVLPAAEQVIYTDIDLSLWNCYGDLLMEVLGPYATIRNQSSWLMPTMSTTVATMMWSKVTSLNGISTRPTSLTDRYTGPSHKSYSTNQTGIYYVVDDSAVSTRPTLLKSGWLYLVFAAQPLIGLTMFVLIIVLHSTPIGKGFGLVSLLAGMDRDSLDKLHGASFSGELERRAQVRIATEYSSAGKGVVVYHIGDGKTKQRSKLTAGIVYS